MAALLLALAGEDLARHLELVAERGDEVVLQPAGEMEHSLFGRLVRVADEFGRTAPAYLDAAEKIGLRAGHLVEPGGLEARVLAEDLRVGMETCAGAAPVLDIAEELESALRHAPREALAVELAAARHLDLKVVRQGVDDGHADAVQAA